MSALTVPEEQEIGLAKIVELNDNSLQELLSALESAPLTIRLSSLFSRVASRVHTIPQDDVDEILEVLLTLNFIRTGADVSTSEFVEDVCEAMDESDSEDLHLNGEDRDNFKQKLSQLLDAKALEIISKARLLSREYEHRFCEAKILSDIRPIFGADPKQSPSALMLIHTLKLSYHEGDELKDFLVALNTEDVHRLRELLDRADLKAESLKSIISSTSIPYVDADVDAEEKEAAYD